MLTKQQHRLLDFIDQRLNERGISPSFEEMKDALGLKSKSGIHRLITALEERGFIRRMPNRARALEVLRRATDPAAPEQGTVKNSEDNNSGTDDGNVITANFAKPSQNSDARLLQIPLHGRIAAGTPIEALEQVDSHVSVPAAIASRAECYALEVSGDSMIEKGILDGDLVVIERSQVAEDGEIVVALVDNEEATLKTLKRDGRKVQLWPANRDYEVQVYNPSQVQIQGKLVGLFRQYH